MWWESHHSTRKFPSIPRKIHQTRIPRICDMTRPAHDTTDTDKSLSHCHNSIPGSRHTSDGKRRHRPSDTGLLHTPPPRHSTRRHTEPRRDSPRDTSCPRTPCQDRNTPASCTGYFYTASASMHTETHTQAPHHNSDPHNTPHDTSPSRPHTPAHTARRPHHTNRRNTPPDIPQDTEHTPRQHTFPVLRTEGHTPCRVPCTPPPRTPDVHRIVHTDPTPHNTGRSRTPDVHRIAHTDPTHHNTGRSRTPDRCRIAHTDPTHRNKSHPHRPLSRCISHNPGVHNRFRTGHTPVPQDNHIPHWHFPHRHHMMTQGSPPSPHTRFDRHLIVSFFLRFKTPTLKFVQIKKQYRVLTHCAHRRPPARLFDTPTTYRNVAKI